MTVMSPDERADLLKRLQGKDFVEAVAHWLAEHDGRLNTQATKIEANREEIGRITRPLKR